MRKRRPTGIEHPEAKEPGNEPPPDGETLQEIRRKSGKPSEESAGITPMIRRRRSLAAQLLWMRMLERLAMRLPERVFEPPERDPGALARQFLLNRMLGAVENIPGSGESHFSPEERARLISRLKSVGASADGPPIEDIKAASAAWRAIRDDIHRIRELHESLELTWETKDRERKGTAEEPAQKE